MDVHFENLELQKKDYENAILLAEADDMKVAYSNDAFELWFLLHYQFLDNQWTRHEYYQKLNEYWNCNYEKEAKKRAFSKTIYKLLEDDENANQKDAIIRATQLLNNQIELALSERNPCTTVYQLVEALNEYIDKTY